jgi:hypothetical protein
MGRGGEDGSDPRHLGDPGNLLRIGGHDELTDQPMVQYTFDDPGDQWLTCQRLKRFVGEAG